ncbi:MAG: hypothetical protein VKK98_04975, partial [Cyanobacteriota bacterium]|nr:hypothetical protein [Cyanobacteriota bacterium]
AALLGDLEPFLQQQLADLEQRHGVTLPLTTAAVGEEMSTLDALLELPPAGCPAGWGLADGASSAAPCPSRLLIAAPDLLRITDDPGAAHARSPGEPDRLEPLCFSPGHSTASSRWMN